METTEKRSRQHTRGIVLRLAWRDLCHEWILSLCLVMAITAVLGPIFILFGLKFGSMELLRNRLVEDPRNREVRPVASARYDQQWFADTAARKDVSFIIPMTRQISTAVSACVLNNNNGQDCKDRGTSIDLLPTAENDPLLLENGGNIPAEEQCVLTTTAARKLGATQGDILKITVKRVIGGKYEKVQRQMKVTSVLDSRAGAVSAMFVSLAMLEAVEQYKDGGSVPTYGWPGKSRRAYPLFDGVIIWTPSPLSILDQLRLKSKTGFSDINLVTAKELAEQTGISIGTEGNSYLLTTRKKAVSRVNVETVIHRLRGKSARVFPWIRPINAEITTAGNNGQQIELASLGYSEKDAGKLAISPAAYWNDLAGKPQSAWLTGFTKENAQKKQTVHLGVRQGNNSLTLPLTLYGDVTEITRRIYIPAELGGILRLLADRQIAFIPESKKFVLARQGYAGFRLYTTTIDQVDSLRQDFESRGIGVNTQAERIRDVKELNYYLTLIFWIITAAAAIGGAATLAASLYGSVERKRREIAVLRLLGFSRTRLLAFPLYQGILLGLGGLAVAAGFFYLLAGLINHLFADMIRANESLCTLAPVHILWFLGGIIIIAMVAAIGAAWRVTRLELVEALRDE